MTTDNQEFNQSVNRFKRLILDGNKRKSITPLSDEEAERRAKAFISNLNISFLLADVCNSFFVDAEEELNLMGIPNNKEDKHRFRIMQESVRKARINVGAYARVLYHAPDADNACYDSDWYYNFIRLVETRIDDARKTHLLLEYLLAMPTASTIYKVTYDDFRRDNYNN